LCCSALHAHSALRTVSQPFPDDIRHPSSVSVGLPRITFGFLTAKTGC
jgi:hypothetical protein